MRFLQHTTTLKLFMVFITMTSVLWFVADFYTGVSDVEAAFNQQINYQGKLTDDAGITVVDGTYQIVFNLYTVSSGGSPIWTETRSGANEVQVTSGLFSVLLGEVTALDDVDFNQTLYLGVTIEADAEMTPRKKLGAVPAAFEAQSLGGATSTQYLRSDQADTMEVTSASTAFSLIQHGAGDILNIFDGSNEVFTILDGGSVGIGNVSPSEKLNVQGEVAAQYFTATSTSATSTFPNLYASQQFRLGSDYVTDLTGTGLSVSAGVLSVDSSASSYWVDGTGFLYPKDGDYAAAPYFTATSTSATSTFAGGLTVGTTNFTVNSGGSIGIGTANPYAKLAIENPTATRPSLVVKSTDNSSTFNAFEIQSSSGSALMSVTAAGAGTYNQSLAVNNGNNVVTSGLTVKRTATFDSGASSQAAIQAFGRSGQTANIVQVGATGATGELFSIDAAGNVGIGTSTPYATLAIDNNAGENAFFIGSSTASTLSTSFIVDHEGNVGIGTNIPSATLDIVGTLRAGGLATLNGGVSINKDGSNVLYASDGSSNSFAVSTDSGAVTLTEMNLGITSTANADALVVNDGFQDVFRIDGFNSRMVYNGLEVGFGISDPQTNFHISESNTNTTPAVEIEQLSTGDAALQFSIVGDAYALGIDNSDSDKFKISYASAAGTAVLGTNDRFVIDESGNVNIVAGDLDLAGTKGISNTSYVKFSDIGNSLQGELTMGFLSENADHSVNWLGAQGGDPSSIELGLPGGDWRYYFPELTGTFALTGVSHNVSFGTLTTSGNVGILDPSPTYNLDVTGNGRFTSLVDASHFVATSTSATSTFAGGLTVGTTNFTVNSGGSIGIGTANPKTILNISAASPSIRMDATSGNNNNIQFYENNVLNAAFLNRGSTNALEFINYQAAPLRFVTNSVDRIFVDSSGNIGFGGSMNGSTIDNSHLSILQTTGNVGIGNVSPSEKLNVQGEVAAQYFTATSTSATSTFAGGVALNGFCVSGRTRVRRRRRKKDGSFEDEEVSLFDLDEGDEIASYDEETKKVVFRKVKAIIETGTQRIFEIKVDGGLAIEVTDTHTCLVKIEGKEVWAKTLDIKVGDQMLVSVGGDTQWREVLSIEQGEIEQVFDLEIEDTHNFFANDILAHNTLVADTLEAFNVNAGVLNATTTATSTFGGPIQMTGDISIGVDSYVSGTNGSALGYSNIASGPASSAFGYDNTALGTYSTASGYSNTASGSYSTASGYNNTASNYGSSAFGYDNTASGYRSSAVGALNTASGIYSTAIGFNVAANNTTSQAFGYSFTNSTANSVAIGYGTPALYTISGGNVGIGTSSPFTKLAVAGTVTANNFNATSTATSTFGGPIQMTGDISIGYNSYVSGSSGSAVGYQSIASGSSASVFGYNSTASGDYSSAVGNTVTASANYAQAFGYGFNNTKANTTAIGWGTPTLFAISGGNVGIGTSSPFTKLAVAGTVTANNFNATSTTATSTFAGGVSIGNGVFQFEPNSGIASLQNVELGAMSFDTDAGIVSWSDLPVSGTPSSGTVQSYTAQIDGTALLTVYAEANGSGGIQNSAVGISTTTPWRTLSVSGTVGFDGLNTLGSSGDAICLTGENEVQVNSGVQTCTVSSARYKDNILEATNNLDIVLALKSSTFTYKGSSTTRFGLIAEEVELVDPRLVARDREGLIQSVHYPDLTAVLVGAVQELSKKIENLGGTMVNGVVNFVELVVGKIKTDELCVGNTCVTETELKAILSATGVNGIQNQNTSTTTDSGIEDINNGTSTDSGTDNSQDIGSTSTTTDSGIEDINNGTSTDSGTDNSQDIGSTSTTTDSGSNVEPVSEPAPESVSEPEPVTESETTSSEPEQDSELNPEETVVNEESTL